MAEWFDKCGKAPWQPPPIVFKIVWPILYGLYYASIVLERGNSELKNYLIFGFLLNLCWVPLFVYEPRLALILLTLMIAVAIKCIILMQGRISFYLFAPYLAWISYAWTLNAYLAVKCK